MQLSHRNTLSSVRQARTSSLRASPVAGPRLHARRAARLRACRAAAPDKEDAAITGFVFSPFDEVEPQLAFVDKLLSRGDVMTSVARTEYSSRLEAAVNEQINVEYTVSYIYHAMAAFFNRDNVGLPGFAAYFKESSDDERHHANLLMAQQNRRGGRVYLAPISRPVSEFFDESKGDALNGVEVGLALEKLNFLKLRQLHAIASEEGDAEYTQFIEDNLLRPQSREVKAAADLFSQVRRSGPGHGVVHIDLELQRKYGYGLDGVGGGGNGNGNGMA
ncbi:MAG: ferritin [Monoraphidium minutum]|nr:MAG: ferritin [Monoraphidium minutum]